MAITWNMAGDFSTVLDASEPLTLVRRGGAPRATIDKAWRVVDRRAEAEPTDGRVLQADVEWQFEWPDHVQLPQLGDRLIDAAGEHYTLLAIHRLRGNTRLKVESRNLRVAHRLDCLMDIEQAEWDAETLVGWTTYRPAIRACVQPSETTVDDSSSSTTRYRVLLEDPELQLDHNHRLVDSDGAVYRLVSFTNAKRIDALPVAVVERE
ncbi:hypothetical protein [Aeoliella mucimassa]|uniref:Uncharacterized protein n=1 Tax=Aeoliella mucimassa TaxID=2527972 RepID=A0A518AHX4_9BACT|nr:hypothetical protein [Aeoliella mucimassa]QDU54328.1 hypothetical protein Pan181_05090 [Aeoliella mucimassa]